jgi:hypothetical protein
MNAQGACAVCTCTVITDQAGPSMRCVSNPPDTCCIAGCAKLWLRICQTKARPTLDEQEKVVITIMGRQNTAYPGRHVPTVGAERKHAGAALGYAVATTPQPPQLFGSLLVLISHPSAGLLLQSLNLQQQTAADHSHRSHFDNHAISQPSQPVTALLLG